MAKKIRYELVIIYVAYIQTSLVEAEPGRCDSRACVCFASMCVFVSSTWYRTLAAI